MNNITIDKVNDVLYIRGQSWQYCAVGELSKLESTGFQTTSLKHVTKTLKVVDSLSKNNVYYNEIIINYHRFLIHVTWQPILLVQNIELVNHDNQ